MVPLKFTVYGQDRGMAEKRKSQGWYGINTLKKNLEDKIIKCYSVETTTSCDNKLSS